MIVIRGNGEAAGKLESVCGVIAKVAEWHCPIARAYACSENGRALDAVIKSTDTQNVQPPQAKLGCSEAY